MSAVPPATAAATAGEPLATERPVGPVHAVLTGFLMGLANLVPGLSGGTMVLIMGLYERFVGAVAEVTSLRPRRATVVFLGLFALGIAVAFLGFAKLAVWAVVTERTASFALFVGLTLGVVPELLAESRPAPQREVSTYGWPLFVLCVAAGFGLVVGVDALGVSSGGSSWWFLALVGALAASSMILPGVSGSYVLLLFGVYELVVGSLPLLAREPVEALTVLVPVGVGVAVGIGAFSNLLKFLLDRASRPTHAALLGLVLGSVVGLWPFQSLVHPELGLRDERKAVEALVVDGATPEAVRAEHGVDWDDAAMAEIAARFQGQGRAELKLAARETRRFAPTLAQVALALALVAAGLVLTRALARVGARHGGH